MKKELLLEGAVAGHMNHIYDNGEMTFGELKQLLQAAASGKLRGTEKTDGQNLSISFNVKSGRAKAARNKGQLKAGGLDPDELDEFFSNHPSQALRFSFVEALQAFEQAVKDLDKEVLKLVRKYVNKTGITNVCLTGGYALNVVCNSYLVKNLEIVLN